MYSPPHLGRVLLYLHSAHSKFDRLHNLRKSQIFGIILIESERRKCGLAQSHFWSAATVKTEV